MPIKQNQVADEAKILSAGSKPTTTTGQGAFYVKTASGRAEAFYADDNAHEVQLTTGGSPMGSGEANTASNVGSGAGLVYKQKTGVNLELKTILAGANVTVTNNASDITIAATGGGGGEANTASNLGAGSGLYSTKVGVDLRFKSLVAGTNITLTPASDTVTIAASGGGSGVSPYQLISPRYQVITTGGEEGYLVTFDPYAKTSLSWSRSGTTLTITSSGHGLSNGDWVVVWNTNIAGQQAGAISNVALNTFDFTVGNTGGFSGSAGSYQRGGYLLRAGSTMQLYGPSDMLYVSGSFRIPSGVATPLIFDYGVLGLNTAAADRFPPQVYQWREDTGAAVVPGTSAANLVTGTFDQQTISMPAANRLFKFVL